MEGHNLAIEWRHADLRSWAPPPAAFDLVSAQYMHLPSAERRPLFDVAREEKIMPEKDLRRVLDPLPMTKGGVQD